MLTVELLKRRIARRATVSSKSAFAKDGATLKMLYEAAAALRQRAAWDHLERVLKLSADFARDRTRHGASCPLVRTAMLTKGPFVPRICVHHQFTASRS